MSNKTINIIIGAGFIVLLLLLPAMSSAAYMATVDWLIPSFEGFRPTPYWDVNRWTWGYGTEAPGPDGTITKEKALADLRAYVQKDYAYLWPMVTRELRPAQWAALLSFSYNEGKYNADNLIANINSGDDNALETQWKKYIYADGVVNSTLIDRRDKEWQVWVSQ